MEKSVNSEMSGRDALAGPVTGRENLLAPLEISHSPRSYSISIGWKIAQVANLAVTVALLVGLVLRPEIALRVMWTVLIPVLPASFLISPLLWRGICPLATLNQWSSGLWDRRQLAGRLLSVANAIGIVLLVLLVPARRFLLNENGPVLAATIALVALAAVILGAFFDGRAGFCNAICPVLPVERLYGQHPLLTLPHPHCDCCTLCIPKGCLDVEATKSFGHAIGRPTGRYTWLISVYGIFAAALPGFIIGYYTLINQPWTAAPRVFLWVALWSTGSYLATAVVVRLFNLRSPVALALLAATSVSLYYWWAAPLIAETLFPGDMLVLEIGGWAAPLIGETLFLPPVGVLVLRVAVFGLVAFWFVRASFRLRSVRGAMQIG